MDILSVPKLRLPVRLLHLEAHAQDAETEIVLKDSVEKMASRM